MTWGNLAALGSTNPKRMLAYSSVAHAGYMLAAITAIGALNWEADHADASRTAALAVVTALMFHLVVLVCFKLGAFLVLSLLESENGGHTLESLGGLVKREPFLAVAMFIFMMSLAGVPPLAGFLSKLLVIMGIVKAAPLGIRRLRQHYIQRDSLGLVSCPHHGYQFSNISLLLPPSGLGDVLQRTRGRP